SPAPAMARSAPRQGGMGHLGAPATPPPPRASSITGAAPPMPMAQAPSRSYASAPDLADDEGGADESIRSLARDVPKMKKVAVQREPSDPILALLSTQAASGLWEEAGKDPIESTATTLVALLRLGVTAAHPVHGAQVKKAVE